jgi:hypothetical protein
MTSSLFPDKTSRGSSQVGVTRLGAERARSRERPPLMQKLLEITSDGDIIEDGEIRSLFHFDPDSLSDDPIE